MIYIISSAEISESVPKAAIQAQPMTPSRRACTLLLPHFGLTITLIEVNCGLISLENMF